MGCGTSQDVKQSKNYKTKTGDELEQYVEQFKQKFLDKSRKNPQKLRKLYSKLENDFYHEDDQPIVRYQSENLNTQIKGIVGLRNLGNTCFMNSVLQCLRNIQPIKSYVEGGYQLLEVNEDNALGSGGIVAIAFTNLVTEMLATSKPYIEPVEFMNIIQYANPLYSAHEEEDAQEFMIFLLDMIHEDLNRVKKKEYIETKEHYKQLSEEEQEHEAAEAWKDYLLRNKSVVVDLFQGQLKNSLQCTECKFMKYKFEPFMYLTLPIPNIAQNSKKSTQIDVEDCLQEFLKEEILEGAEKWMCPICKKLVKAKKKIDLWKLPNVLLISFKRFKFVNNQLKKITAPISFTQNNFKMNNYIPQKLQKTQPVYDLFAALSHEGTMNKGHYVSYAQVCNDNQWYLFNDSQIKKISNPEKQINQEGIYMLYYQKSTMQLIKRQTLTNPQYWPHMSNDDEEFKQNLN